MAGECRLHTSFYQCVRLCLTKLCKAAVLHLKPKSHLSTSSFQNGPARQPKDVLRDMQQGLKDVGANVRAGISGFGGGVVEGVKGGVSALTHTAVVSKPREFASLIRNKFGSADNIAHLKDSLEDGVGGHSEDTPTPRALSGSATLVSSPKYGSDDECSSATSGSAVGSNSGGAGTGGGILGPMMGSPRLDGHHHHQMHGSWDSLLEGLQEIKASQTHMEDAIEDMKGQLQSDYSYMTQCLQEERYRYSTKICHLTPPQSHFIWPSFPLAGKILLHSEKQSLQTLVLSYRAQMTQALH